MTALLAQPWYPLAVGWGARPAWWLQHMALGGSIGQVHLRTVNNGMAKRAYRESMDYFPPGKYLFRNAVWVNLLGDPTLHAFPLAPPTKLHAQNTAQGVQLSWSASPDPDVLGYRLFRAAPGSNHFTPLDDGALLTKLAFSDPAAVQNARYMLRAYGLKQVYAGSFYTFSQGVFAEANASAESTLAQNSSIATAKDVAVRLPAMFSRSTNGNLYAIIQGPTRGTLVFDGADWVYTPPLDFTGRVTLRFSVSNALRTDEAVLTINIGG